MKTTGSAIDIFLNDIEKGVDHIRDYFESVENERTEKTEGRKTLTLVTKYPKHDLDYAVIVGPAASWFAEINGTTIVYRDRIYLFKALGETLGFNVVIREEK